MRGFRCQPQETGQGWADRPSDRAGGAQCWRPVGAGPSGGTLTLFSCLRSRPGLPTPFAGTLINRFSCLVRGINNPDKSAAVRPPPLGPRTARLSPLLAHQPGLAQSRPPPPRSVSLSHPRLSHTGRCPGSPAEPGLGQVSAGLGRVAGRCTLGAEGSWGLPLGLCCLGVWGVMSFMSGFTQAGHVRPTKRVGGRGQCSLAWGSQLGEEATQGLRVRGKVVGNPQTGS